MSRSPLELFEKPLRPLGPRFLPERTTSAAERDVVKSVKKGVWGQTRAEIRYRRKARPEEGTP